MERSHFSKREILAFTHIKKAAGTTLSHILRINFFLRHCDVKVLSVGSGKCFQAEDMFKLFQINPYIASIGGHSVVPFGNLAAHFQNIRFITVLRDPVQRYLSQYQHNVEKLGHSGSFQAFLENRTSWNKQVRTIAGSEDLDKAKRLLEDRFLLVGLAEGFDKFLILLKKKLGPKTFHPGYRIQNIGKKDSPIRKELEHYSQKHHQRIEQRNSLDIELYEFVKYELLPREIRRYGPNFIQDVDRFKSNNKDYSRKLLWFFDYIVRKIYYRPLIKLIRKKSGFEKY